MNPLNRPTKVLSAHNGGGTAASTDPGAVNAWLLGVLAGAWRHYPSPVDLTGHDQFGEYRGLIGKLLDRLAQEGIIAVSDSSVALSEAGHAAVERASRSDDRLAELLRTGVLADPSTASSLVLAILRAHLEQRRGVGGV